MGLQLTHGGLETPIRPGYIPRLIIASMASIRRLEVSICLHLTGGGNRCKRMLPHRIESNLNEEDN
jgi:hypothetical protein